MSVVQINTKDEFDSKVKGASGLAVVDFYATWCGPCKMIAPKIEAMTAEFPEVGFFKVDVDEVTEVSEECGISAMPTFQLFKGGAKVDEVVGASEANIRAKIQEYK